MSINGWNKKKLMSEDRDPFANPLLAVSTHGTEPNSITLMADAENEMLKVTRDGFYVRGVRVPADEKEAELVYNAFKEFLVYHNLTRQY